MSHIQKLKLNTTISLISKAVIMVSGIILPRLILINFGSEINGLVSSVTQFLAVITFLDLGVGSVVQSALYKPLVNKDTTQISAIINTAKNYFQKIGLILIVYVLFLILFYPSLIDNNVLDFISTGLLIISLSISNFAQYYFGIVNELLLNADQKGYIQLSTEIIVVILNLILSVFLIYLGASIVTVTLVSSLVILIRPVFLNIYVKKNYMLDYNMTIEKDYLPQKWSGMGQHIAYSIQNSTDIVVLTVFSTLENVSIYSVYKMVVGAIGLIINSFTIGLQSFFGNLLANNDIKKLNVYFTQIEWGLHNLVILIYGMTSVLIIPFVEIYTFGVNDADYFVPSFAFLLILSRINYSLRTPYQGIVFSAGYFNQTQKSSYIEAFLNISLSLIMVFKFGLIGVVFGSFIAISYRLLYLVFFLRKNIIYRPISIFLKLLIVDIILFILISYIGSFLKKHFLIINYSQWIVFAIILGVISILILILLNLFFYRKQTIGVFKKVFKK